MLRAHGLDNHSVQTVYNAIVMSKLLYASPAWYGFTSKEDNDRIDSFMKKSSKSAFAPPDQTSFASLCENLTTKCSKKSVWTSIMCYIICCRLWMSRATIFVVELIHSPSQLNAKLSYRTKISLNEFFLKIHINGKIVLVNNVLIEFRQTL